MAAATNNVRRIDEVPEYHSTPAERPAGAASVRFKFDGEEYVLNRPKMVITMHMLRIKDGELSIDAGWDTIQLLSSLLHYIQEEPPDADGKPRGRQRLMNRLSDPKDKLDLIDLAQPFMDLMDKVFRRPTTPPAASSRQPARTSRAGGGGTRSRQRKTS